MLAAEVVENHVEREHVSVILELLRESICEARETPILHTKGQVPTLHVCGRDVLVAAAGIRAR